MTLALRLAALAALALPVGIAAQPAAIDTVTAAMEAGQAGERFDGYLGLNGEAPEAVERSVNAINIKRRALYLDMAQRKGVSPEDISFTATCTTFARVPVGQYYMAADRVWRQRTEGQPAPVPDYCAEGMISKSGL